MKRLFRQKGISVLLPTQNERRIAPLSIRSFLDFADEIIVVDNGSTDGTVEIVKELAVKHQKVQFYNRPDIHHLYENRQFALERSKYQWICRFDSDYIAYTSGNYDVRELREIMLNTRPGFPPKVFGVMRVNVTGDFWHTGVSYDKVPKDERPYIFEQLSGPEIRIYQYFPGLRFVRRNRREGIAFEKLLTYSNLPSRIDLKKPYWMHCMIKSDMNYFFRSERPNWRATGDFDRYPTLESYMMDIILEKYGTTSIEEACHLFMHNRFYPLLKPYDDSCYPYPKIVHEQMKQTPMYFIEETGQGFVRHELLQ